MTEDIVKELKGLVSFLESQELRIEIIKEEEKIKKVIVSQNYEQEIQKPIFEDNIVHKNEEVLNKKIVELMLNLGLDINTKGFMYIYEAICILYKENIKLMKKGSKWVYVEIGNKYDDISQKVHIAIRAAIEVSWNRGKIEEQKNIFGYTREDREKPSNSEYLNSIVAYLKTKP